MTAWVCSSARPAVARIRRRESATVAPASGVPKRWSMSIMRYDNSLVVESCSLAATPMASVRRRASAARCRRMRRHLSSTPAITGTTSGIANHGITVSTRHHIGRSGNASKLHSCTIRDAMAAPINAMPHTVRRYDSTTNGRAITTLRDIDNPTGNGNATHHVTPSSTLPATGRAIPAAIAANSTASATAVRQSNTGAANSSIAESIAANNVQASMTTRRSPSSVEPRTRPLAGRLLRLLASQHMVPVTVIEQFAAIRHIDLAHGAFDVAVHSFNADTKPVRNLRRR